MNIEALINFKRGAKMDYILLILVIILFFNKQNRDRLIKHNHIERFYDKDKINNITGSKYEKLTNNQYLKNDVISTKKNIEEKYKINNFDNTRKARVNNYEEYYEADNDIKNKDLKNNIVGELNKIEIYENIDSENQHKNLEKNIETEENDSEHNKEIFTNKEKYIRESEDIKEKNHNKESNYNKELSYESYDESEKDEKEYIDLNDNQQYKVVDICESNQKLKESQELYKENIINNETVDNIEEVITYREEKEAEEIHTENKETYKEDKESYKEDEEIYKSEVKGDDDFKKSKNKFNEFKKRYKGVNVSILISGVGIIEGEIVFDFPNIIAVKNKEDIIIFIDESKILGIY